ncbi:unnamed protein product [Symbiodinium sp. CCMP2592]|nr:unnamed protein product [Symbiodinium sp. CCMP2592]
MAKKEDTTAKKENESMMGKAYRYMDSFHNVEPDRPPSSIGCLLTVLMVPVVLIYIVVWVVQHEGQPPVESMVIDWSVSKGPFPMKVSCAEASCWMWISGCTSGSSDQCIAMSSGESRTIEMCYSNAAREGLHMWWSSPNGTDPTTAGVKIYSQALNMEMNQLVEPGRSSMTYVKTHDTTQEESDYNHLRHEWFVMYLSSQALEPAHQGARVCRSVHSSALRYQGSYRKSDPGCKPRNDGTAALNPKTLLVASTAIH